MATIPELVLASGSPRRRELLAGLGLQFEIRAADVDETPHPGEPPRDYVLRLAREKAAAVARSGSPGELVLAAASPKAFQQIAAAQILPPTVRAYPALADGILYMRNDDTLVALDLR